MRNFHKPIDNFEAQMRDRYREAQAPDLSILCENMSTLRSEEHLLVERYILVSPLVIPLFMKSLPRPPRLIFDIFIEDDESPIIRAYKEHKQKE